MTEINELPDDPKTYFGTYYSGGHDTSPHPCRAYEVSSLPPHHHDPFDRLLIAQPRLNDRSIVTADRTFAEYDVRRIAI